MNIDMYEISLEHYVKSYVDFKALKTARERGTYDKAIMRFVLDFTRKTAPKRVWGVNRTQLVEDMSFIVSHFSEGSLIAIDGTCFAFRNHAGYWRILYASSVDEYEYKVRDAPNAFSAELCPVGYFEDVKELHGDHAILITGERIDFEYRLLDTIVNVIDRLYVRNDAN